MKKKLYSTICVLCLAVITLCACGKQENPIADNEPEAIAFQATVIEINKDTILVKPVDGSSELNSADKFSIPNDENLELQVDDLLEITYNGDIMESYPAQLGEVYEITLIEQTIPQ
ncbi:MAG: YobA family protein [Lachnospiraceae bacterium]|nr:YobA family protein [Lachnospiraceae bacterium]